MKNIKTAARTLLNDNTKKGRATPAPQPERMYSIMRKKTITAPETVQTKAQKAVCSRMKPCAVCGFQPVLQKKKLVYSNYYRYKCGFCTRATEWLDSIALKQNLLEQHWNEMNE